MSGWQPINSAPKDGTAFMVWAAGFEWPEIVRWAEYDEAAAEEAGAPGYWRYAEDLLADVTDDCWPETWTHWQSLPTPPEEA